LLAGCASAPEIPFDRAAAPNVKTIGIMTPGAPDGATVVLASSVGQSFGLVGALIDAGMQSARDSKVKDMLKQQSMSAPDNFVDAVKAGLEQHGYTVVSVPGARDRDDFAKTYPKETGVDAFLDLVTTSYGYVAAGIGSATPYRPTYAAKVRLVGANGAPVLLQDAVFYNPVRPTNRTITVAPDAALQFKDFDALVADPTKAAEALRTAAEQSGATVAKLLR
jgi:hypothetical protein